MISQEDMAVLSEFETTFDAAINKGYGRNLGMNIYRKINNVYEHIYGKRYEGRGWGCPSCNFDFILKMAKIYFEEKQRLADEAKLKAELAAADKPKQDAPKNSDSSKANRTTKKTTSSKNNKKNTKK